MKSVTSRSLAPFCSCSRIWLRRSTASGALESASVWFWHTRQRSSCARAATRLSSAVSSAARAMEQTSSSAASLATAQLLQQRRDLALRHLGADRADVLVADHAALVDDVGLGHAVDAVVDRDAPARVGHRQPVRVAVALEPGQRVLARV